MRNCSDLVSIQLAIGRAIEMIEPREEGFKLTATKADSKKRALLIASGVPR